MQQSGSAATPPLGTISGKVINKTSKLPASGDKVTILNASDPVVGVGTTKTDANGRFTVPLPSLNLYLIQVEHQNVNAIP